MLRELLGQLGLEAWPKTSGSKGMQVYVPLNTPTSYEHTKPFAHAIAQLLERREPKLIVSEMNKASAAGACSSTGARTRATRPPCASTRCARVSARRRRRRCSWEEVEAVTASRDPDELAFTSDQVLDRVAEHGDLFAPVLEREQELPQLAA
jgi:bifunctional non-homologous end joining protein LigD